MLSWNEYIKKEMIRKTSLNKGVIRSLIEISNNRIKTMKKLEFEKDTSSVIFTNYYDSLREICEAICLLKGYKIYSHEAVGLFLRDFLKEQAIFAKFDRFRVLRNGINYYWKKIEFETACLAVKDIENIVDELKQKYLNNV